MHQEFFKIPDWQMLLHFIQVQIMRPFGTDLRNWEWLALIVSFAVVWAIPRSWLTWFRIRFHNYAQRKWLAIWTVALLPIVLRVALLPVIPLIAPSIHDEFSWLLMGDTFRLGRLTNPAHPLWQHFETIHVIQQPTYNSMYPPGFGVLVAIGYLLHNPWAGVFLSVALMCGAACWALQAWVPPGWAFAGSLVIAIQLGVASCWINSFVGGAPLPFMAGALLLGALARFTRKPTPGLALVQAVAIVLLVNTRPFEGVALSACCVLYLAWHLRVPSARAGIGWRTAAPAVLVLAAGAAFTLYYNWRVTNHPFTAPYVVNRETYGWPENIAILPPQKVEYRHKILKDMHGLELGWRVWYSTFGRMLASWFARYAEVWEFFIGPAFTLPILFIFPVLRNRKYHLPFFLLAVMLALNTLQHMAYPQHVAAEAIIFYIFLAAGLRQVYVRAGRFGLRPERIVLAMFLCMFGSAWMLLTLDRLHPQKGIFWEWPHSKFGGQRAAMIAKLERLPGKHLMIVRYGPLHTPNEEWVYNGADIDNGKIVWANSMGAKDDRELMSYFHDRQPWLVEPDRDPLGFLPLTPGTYGTDEEATEQTASGARR